MESLTFCAMSTVADITKALDQLDVEQLLQIEGRIHALQRQRSNGVIFDDDYGLWTEEDQASAAVQAWEILEASEAKS